jgi:isopenicillin-N N-acyltransferase-like protein
MKQLISKHDTIGVERGASILRNTLGLNDKFIGYGNPKSINQLLAHHGILFKPAARRLWVSANPYQLGEFVEYDLSKVFSRETLFQGTDAAIAPDPFLSTKEYQDFEAFKKIRNNLTAHLLAGHPLDMSEQEADAFVALNPESYQPYLLLGDFYKKKEDYPKATRYYGFALSKELPSRKDEINIRKKLAECTR